MSVQFTCEQCNREIEAFALNVPPPDGLCFVCSFLEEYVPDPDKRRKLRERLDLDALDA